MTYYTSIKIQKDGRIHLSKKLHTNPNCIYLVGVARNIDGDVVEYLPKCKHCTPNAAPPLPLEQLTLEFK